MDQLSSEPVTARGIYDRPWREIASRIRTDITAGAIRAGDRLPTTAELAQRYPVKGRVRAKNTIRAALIKLTEEGFIETRGRSYYVREGVEVTPPASTPEPEPVVAAVVTSHLGVLAGRRNDGKPPWTFIAGKVQPGEAIADAAVREVKEETGLEVRAAHHEIGRRVHPKTGRTMIYLSCLPVAGTAVFVGDEEELAEVRWLSLPEADELLTGMFEPVREHLGRMIS